MFKVVNAVLDDIHPRRKSLSDGFTSGCTKSRWWLDDRIMRVMTCRTVMDSSQAGCNVRICGWWWRHRHNATRITSNNELPLLVPLDSS